MIRKYALVTGASSGIGSAIAKKLASLNCNLIINYNKNISGAEETAQSCKEFGVEAIIAQGNVTSYQDCCSIINKAIDAWGKIDILVNNAGITKFPDTQNLSSLNINAFNVYNV